MSKDTPDNIRDIFTILGKVFNEGRLYELPEAWAGDLDKCMSPREAETAINAYILGEVEKLIGDDEVYEGHTINWEIEHHNQLRQELRNKAYKKFGGK